MNKMDLIPETVYPKGLDIIFKPENFKDQSGSWDLILKLIKLMHDSGNPVPSALVSFVDTNNTINKLLRENIKVGGENPPAKVYNYISKHGKDFRKAGLMMFKSTKLHKSDLNHQQAMLLYVAILQGKWFLAVNTVITLMNSLLYSLRHNQSPAEDEKGKVLTFKQLNDHIIQWLDNFNTMTITLVNDLLVIKDPYKHFMSISKTKITKANEEFLMGSKRDNFFIAAILTTFAVGVAVNFLSMSRSVVSSKLVQSAKLINSTTRSLELLKISLEEDIRVSGVPDPAKERELQLVNKQIQRQRAVLRKMM